MHDIVKCQCSSKQKHNEFITAKEEATSAVTGTPDVPDKGSVILFSVSLI